MWMCVTHTGIAVMLIYPRTCLGPNLGTGGRGDRHQDRISDVTEIEFK